MGKIKKLWKLLAGSISWNLNESKTTNQIIKSGNERTTKRCLTARHKKEAFQVIKDSW